jgi:predicted Zn-dependent peptidase
MSKPIFKKLPNGVRFVCIPRKESMSVTAAVFVEAGSEYEQKKISGISHFLEHMMFKGTGKRPSPLHIAAELENLGASYNAFTDFDLTGYHATVAAPLFEKAFDVIADMYLHPLLQDEEIQKEKGVIVEEIRMYEDLPRSKVSETLDALMYGDQPAGWSIAGTPQTVTSFTRDDIRAYRAKHYIAPKTIVVIAGNIDPAQALAKTKEYFSQAPKGKAYGRVPTKKHKGEHVAIIHKKLDQSHFMAGFPAVPFASPEWARVSLLAKVLGGGMGSRLFQKIREEMGAAYYVGASTTYNANHGMFYIQGGINHGKLREVFTAVLEEVRKIKENIGAHELVRAKEYAIGNFLLSLETSSDIATYYGYQQATAHLLDTPEQIVKEFKRVTLDDLKRMANKYLKKEGFRFALVGLYETSEKKKYEEIYKKTKF